MSRDFPGGSSDRYYKALPFTSMADFTFAFWINLDAAQAIEARPFRFGTSASAISIGFRTASSTTIQWVDEGIAWRGSGSSLSTATWHLVLFYRAASGNVFMEVDGTAVENFGATPNTPTGNVMFGAPEDNPNSLNGKMGEVGVWNVALSAEERAALAKGVSPRQIRPGSLKAYAPAWGGGTNEIDMAVGGVWTAVGTIPTYNHPPVGPPVPA